MSYNHLSIVEREKLPDSDKSKNVRQVIAGLRTVEASERRRRGDWEADTIVGFNRKSGLLTLI